MHVIHSEMIQKNISCVSAYVCVCGGWRMRKQMWQNVKSWWSCNNFLGLQLFQNQLKHDSRKILDIFAYFSRQTSQSLCLWFPLIILLKVLLPAVLARSDIIKIFLNRHMVILIIYWDLLFPLLVIKFAFVINPWTLLFVHTYGLLLFSKISNLTVSFFQW